VLPLLSPKETSPALAKKETSSRPQTNPLEGQQKAAMDAADKLVAANDLDGALKSLDQAKALNGPLAAEIQSKRASIVEAMQNQSLRTLRQKEEQLWQQAKADVALGRFREAEKSLQQILVLGDGGLRKNDARQYLTKTIPARQQEEDLFNQARQAAGRGDLNSLQSAGGLLGKVIALDSQRKPEAEKLQYDVRRKLAGILISGTHQDLQRGDLRAARQKASQLQQNGGDASPLLGEIDQAEQTRFAQLQGSYDQLKQSSDDAAAQELANLQREFQKLADSSGPRAEDAKNIGNSIPAAIRDVHERAAGKRADAAYQQVVSRYQQAAAANDKSGLEAARNGLQPIAQAGGAHAGEAQKYLDDINTKLAALNAPPPVAPPVKTEAPPAGPVANDAVLSLIKRYEQAYDQRSADSLRQIWPAIGNRYGGFKNAFDSASSIRMQVRTDSVKISPDGGTATVTARFVEEFTPQNQKPKSVQGKIIFQFAKMDGIWVITDVQ
jgi:hypothetical protein